MKGGSAWEISIDPFKWDYLLGKFGGHPLQSALWGSARQKVDGIAYLSLVYKDQKGDVTGLARIEERHVPLNGKAAWIPKGPVLPADDDGKALVALKSELKRRGFLACFTDYYVESTTSLDRQPKTIWMDLTLGLDQLSKRLDSQWRYGSKRALREGVIVRETRQASDVSTFFLLCDQLSIKKGFALPGSEALMQELIHSSLAHSSLTMRLYIAEIEGIIAGGVVVAQSGTHLHYLWGASDRQFSKYRVSEAIQWRVIQDGVASGMTRYDLEGIDPCGNPGVYQFKKKMGGVEVVLQGVEAIPLSMVGGVALAVGKSLKRI